MITAKKSLFISVVVALVALAGGVSRADWSEGDGHKMHFPQLPDPNGWDVLAGDTLLGAGQGGAADDWQCSQTGPVEDIHIWGSWKQGQTGAIGRIRVAIFYNIPAGVDIPFSRPGPQLWSRDFTYGQFTYVHNYGTGEQGWYDPTATSGGVVPNDHSNYHQINIENIDAPFLQTRDEIYWLRVQVDLDGDHGSRSDRWGWKTSQNHWNDDAVWPSVSSGPFGDEMIWHELRDPITGESLDLAFVITPEPATLAVLLIGGLLFLARRSR